MPLGEFICPITFEIVRPPRPIVKEEAGITYVVQRDYEIAFPNGPPLHKRERIADQGKAARREQPKSCHP